MGSQAIMAGTDLVANMPTPQYQQQVLDLNAPSPFTGIPNICQLVKQVNDEKNSATQKELAEELLELFYEGMELTTPCLQESSYGDPYPITVGTLLPTAFWKAFEKNHPSIYMKSTLEKLYLYQLKTSQCDVKCVLRDIQAAIDAKAKGGFSSDAVFWYNKVKELTAQARDEKLGKAMKGVLAARKAARNAQL